VPLAAQSCPPAATLGPVSKRPGEQNWYPVSQVSWFTGHIREGIAVTGRQLELLQPARARPSVLDDATVARIIRVHHDQAADLTLFQNQASRWKAGPGLTTAQRDAVAGFEAAIGQLRQLNSEVLAVAEELSHGTIETVLAKSDLELGIETLAGCLDAESQPLVVGRQPGAGAELPVGEVVAELEIQLGAGVDQGGLGHPAFAGSK